MGPLIYFSPRAIFRRLLSGIQITMIFGRKKYKQLYTTLSFYLCLLMLIYLVYFLSAKWHLFNICIIGNLSLSVIFVNFIISVVSVALGPGPELVLILGSEPIQVPSQSFLVQIIGPVTGPNDLVPVTGNHFSHSLTLYYVLWLVY